MQLLKRIFLKTKKFKLRGLKTYNNTRFLYENRKKYRKVFDRLETDYIYCELSLFNKFFDKKDWSVKVRYKCFSQKNPSTPLCDLTFHREVKKEMPVFYVREGWGNKKIGAFWKSGTYYWKVYIDNEKISETDFYIIDNEKQSPSFDSYFQFKSLKLYEGNGDTWDSNNHLGLSEFDANSTRYIHQSMRLSNSLTSKSWFCEITSRIFSKNRDLIAENSTLKEVKEGCDEIEINQCWGAVETGSWNPDEYILEYSFLEKIFVRGHFKVGQEHKEGFVSPFMPPFDSLA